MVQWQVHFHPCIFQASKPGGTAPFGFAPNDIIVLSPIHEDDLAAVFCQHFEGSSLPNVIIRFRLQNCLSA
jgi:hypothetical protein